MSQEQNQEYKETVFLNDEEISFREGTLEQLNFEEEKCLADKPPMLGKSKVDDAIKVSKFVWDIIKDSKAEAVTSATTTRVLSSEDSDWKNYEYAKNFESDKVTYKLDNFAGVNCYTVKFKVAGTYRAVNPNFGGKWIPNIHITFFECHANFPWIINGSVVIDDKFVSNMGSKKDPIPQLVLNVKIKTDAKFAFNWESHERTFEFTMNGEDGVKLIK